MKIQRDGYKFTITADDAKQADTLEALFQALEARGPFRRGKVTVALDLEFDGPMIGDEPPPPATKAKPKAKAKAKAK